ncbi:cyclin-domain-containing protein [Kockiozyma suomiensis]|uniref:cyclin-domain-containing protein n=1 Tax=Kockiozyma suomiensis TaxID=1337062 RepID=UPI0033440303
MADFPGAPAPPYAEHSVSLQQQLFAREQPFDSASSTATTAAAVISPSISSSLPSSSSLTTPSSDSPHLDILSHPVAEVLTMIAALLQRIIEANDSLYMTHHAHHRPHPDGRPRSGLAASVLAFHGRNVPAISLQAYLMRILKYCPATNEVFLSLLVYFDRISKRANAGDFSEADPYRPSQTSPPSSTLSSSSFSATSSSVMPVAIGAATVVSSESMHGDTSSSVPATPLAYSSSYPQHAIEPGSFGSQMSQPQSPLAHPPIGFTSPSPPPPPSFPPSSDVFVMDSYNIHRLVISGVTVASKFFSDVFYKNSRYAKVGGLPLEELNHLELQFLVLCDFRLAIPLEELQRYGDLLLQFWDREVPAQNKGVPPIV